MEKVLIKKEALAELKNAAFDKLSNMINTSETIQGFVYKQLDYGFNVSYEGFNCFLPNKFTYYFNEKFKDLNNILNTYQEFTVNCIDNGFINLSRKDYLKRELGKLTQMEINNITKGDIFIGKIKTILDYGVFITNKYSDGLLHITKVFPDYSPDMSKEEKEELKFLLEKTFQIGENILVVVEQKTELGYSLDLNK